MRLIAHAASLLALSGTIFAQVSRGPIVPQTKGTWPLARQLELRVSNSADRSKPRPLEGEVLSGEAYVFLAPTPSSGSWAFHLDDPGLLAGPVRTENIPPYDFAGTAPDDTAFPWDTAGVVDGQHVITAVRMIGGAPAGRVEASFTVGNALPSLVFDLPSLDFALLPDEIDSAAVGLDTSFGSVTSWTTSENAGWLNVFPAAGTTPEQLTVEVDSTGLPEGTYMTTLSASATGYLDGELDVMLQVGTPSSCSPLPCGQILISLPYELDFGSDHGGIADGSGVGTGFTYVDWPSNSIGYRPELLTVDTAQGKLQVTTTAGIQYGANNALDNALGVGVDVPSQTTEIRALLVDPPAGTGNFEQAGLWFGNDEDDYIKLVVQSTSSGEKIQALMEVGGGNAGSSSSGSIDFSGREVELCLRVDPFAQKVFAEYRLDAGATSLLHTFTPPSEFFSFDAAGINPEIGTRSFTGVWATHRNGLAPMVYEFDEFSVREGVFTPTAGELDFERVSFPVSDPTSLAWGPDGRLYVTSLFGDLSAFTLDEQNLPIGEETITALTDAKGARLTLGIAIDPASTAGNVILYVAHSNASLGNGELNSGTVTRLSGPGFATVEDVISGLPRAIANHSINSIHFGPDGRLYIAMGGNTGAGAPNTANTEFGDRAEQALSAALLVADIHAPGFDGTCANDADPFGPIAPCDVVPWATGLRNTYGFLFHSNGQVYAPDNGLGVTGSFPPSPSAPCFGLGDTNPVAQGGHNPGTQIDPLNRLVEGSYYGHPNPARGECVFGDGSLQGVAPPPNYQPHFLDLGTHKSADGIAEYPFDVGCVPLGGDILISNYSVGDDLTRVRLSLDGLSVLETSTFVDGFSNPLSVIVNPGGTIFVAEYGGDAVTALVPLSRGCWNPVMPMPTPVLDASGAAVAGKLYAVGGKDSAGHRSSVFVYDPATDSWSSAPDLPGAAVENAAATTWNGKLYVFGGSTGPFSGAVDNAHVFDPATQQWNPLAPLPTARGGATASVLAGSIYVCGGMDGSGASLATVERYDPGSDSWSTLADMSTRRDNPGSAALDGKIFVFGGRIRESSGTTTDGTLSSVEAYDPGTDSWSPCAPMPTGRRAVVVGVLNGRALVIGGERTPSGGAFDECEEYDPIADTWRSLAPISTGRHGAAGAAIGNAIFVAGGGPSGGSSYSALLETFSY